MHKRGLTVGELNRRPHRIDIFVKKIIDGKPFTIVTDKQELYGSEVVISALKYKDDVYNTNEQMCGLLINGKGKSINVITQCGYEFRTSCVAKTKEFSGQSTINKGYIGELLFSIAHVVLIECGEVTSKLIEDYIMDMSWANERVTENYNNVKFTYKYPQSIIAATQDMIASGEFGCIMKPTINAVIEYVNTNTKPQKLIGIKGVEILGDGLSSNTKTKSDVEIITPCDNGYKVSLKCGSVSQFSQVGGTNHDTMKRLFDGLCDVDTFTDIYNTYENVALQLNQANKTNFADRLSSYIIQHMTLGEDIDIVKLNTHAYVYNFETMKTYIREHIETFECEYKFIDNNNFKLILKLHDKPLIVIRYRLDGTIKRNVIETRNLLTNIL